MVGGIDLFFLMDSLVDGNEECDTGEVQIDGWIFEKKTPYFFVSVFGINTQQRFSKKGGTGFPYAAMHITGDSGEQNVVKIGERWFKVSRCSALKSSLDTFKIPFLSVYSRRNLSNSDSVNIPKFDKTDCQ